MATPPPAESGGRMGVSSAGWLAGGEVSSVAAERHRHLELAVGDLDVARTARSAFWPAVALIGSGAPDRCRPV